MKEPKYILIVGDGKSLRCPTITGNNKAELIRWAREECIRATVAVKATGDIIFENAAQRRINKSISTIKRLADDLRAGKPVESLIELP